MLCMLWDPVLQTLVRVPMGGLGWPAKAAQGLAVKHMYKSLWNWSVVQSGLDPDLNWAVGKMSGLTRAEALGRWRGFGPLKHFLLSQKLDKWQSEICTRTVSISSLPIITGSSRVHCELWPVLMWKTRGTCHQSGGSNFLFSGFSNPPTLPNPVIHSKMRICWCRYAYVHTHPQAEVSVCTQRSYVCIFFMCMPTCPLDSLSWGQLCFVPIGKFQTRCTLLLQSSISFT